MMASGRLRGILLLCVSTLMVACADMKHRISSRPPDPSPPPAADSAPPPPPLKERARGHLQAGDYQKAIDIYHAGYLKAPDDQTLLRAYVQGLEYMAASANQALERREAGDAGKAYDILLKNYTRFSGFDTKRSFTRTSLKAKLNDCKKTLFKQVFQAYRKGNLSQSIALWENLLVIDPQNTDIQETLRVAKLQQKNLTETE